MRSSFWFIPAIMAAAAVALAFAAVAAESVFEDRPAYTGGAEGATAMLGTIAGSMITIAGVVFSITLVALSLASSQFGPRLLRNFMRDTANQVVLGTFVATFLYCLLVLRTVRHSDDAEFVPHLAVTIGVLLAVLSLGVLIYFIHHVSLSIHADQIVARVHADLTDEIDALYPPRSGDERPLPGEEHAPLPEFLEAASRSILAPHDGYLQYVDMETLTELGRREDVVIRLERRPGHYLVADAPMASVWPASRVSEDVGGRIRTAFVIGNQRTEGQDVEYAIGQLVEIALRALSPSVNDPFTAISCVDRLGSGLCRLAPRDVPPPIRTDADGRTRVISPAVTFPAVVNAAFDQIRQHARTSAAVTIRLLDTIAVIAQFVRRAEDRAALQRQADMILRGADDGLPEAEDRRVVEERYRRVAEALRTSAPV